MREITSEECFKHLRNIIDTAIAAVGELYLDGERSQKFAQACARMNRAVKLLQAYRRVNSAEE